MINELKKNSGFIFSSTTVFGLLLGRLAGFFDTILNNPMPFVIYGIEMHHFIYGLVVLSIALPLFFNVEKKFFIIAIIGISYGVMLDDLLLMMKLPYIPYSDVNAVYMETWPATFIFIMIFSIFSIYIILKKRSNA